MPDDVVVEYRSIVAPRRPERSATIAVGMRLLSPPRVVSRPPEEILFTEAFLARCGRLGAKMAARQADFERGCRTGVRVVKGIHQ